jgi:formiminotetrahydrofolate cyclodeaminase
MTEKKQLKLLDLPTTQLLDKFGAGGHKPGSGSAAALMGVLSGKLIATVCKLSLTKPKYREHKSQFEYAIKQIDEEIEERLKDHFHRDAEIFDAVIKLRVARNAATSDEEKKEFRKEELKCLREATEIPFKIAEECFRLIDLAVFIFDSGFQSARGDSGAAVSAAIAGVSSAIFVINLNLRSFKKSKWKDDIQGQTEELLKKLQDKQMGAFSRITTLSDKEVEEMDFDIPGSQ